MDTDTHGFGKNEEAFDFGHLCSSAFTSGSFALTQLKAEVSADGADTSKRLSKGSIAFRLLEEKNS